MNDKSVSIKQADSNSDFERAFFELAYDKLQGKLSNLVQFLVGFQLVDKSDNDTKAVGVFGFKGNNGQILFVPTFFLNGKIKDLDLLYSKNNNQMYPLNEDFAELFLKNDVTGLGSVSNQTKEEINKDVVNPNMRNIIWPPRTGRISYASVIEDTEKNKDTFEKSAELMSENKSTIPAPSLIDYIAKSDNVVKEAFYELMHKDAEFTDAVRKFYSDEQIADSLRVEPIVKEAKAKKLKVVDFDTGNFKDLSEHSKKEVATRGFSIIDNRLDQDVSELGIFKFREAFTNPTETGFYPYITEMGTIRYGLILAQTENLIVGFSHPKVIVIDLEAKRKGQAYECDSNKVFIKDQIKVKDLSSTISLLEEPAEALPGYEDYVLINERLQATEPFRIIENYKDSNGIRRIKVEPIWYNEAKLRVNYGEPTDCERMHSGAVVLVLTKKPGDRLEHRNKAVYVPKGFKLLKLYFQTSYYPDIDLSLPKAEIENKKKERDEERSRIRAGKPGAFSYLTAFLRENNTFPLTLHTNGSSYFLNVAGAKVTYDNPIEAKIAMVEELGLREKDAEFAMDNLIPNKKKTGFIKIAVTGDHTLNLYDETPEHNELGQPTYYGIPGIDMYNCNDGYTGNPVQQGLGVKPDTDGLNNTINEATQLAQSGQKEIFDTQTISALSKYTNTPDKITEYVPSFVGTLDKLGRLLFLAYSNTDDFEEIYGKDTLPELIELIKSVFKHLGEMIIFMKRKIPDLSINSNEQSKNDI